MKLLRSLELICFTSFLLTGCEDLVSEQPSNKDVDNPIIGEWVNYNSSSDGKYKVNLFFNANNEYLEIFQYYEAVSTLPENAFIPDTNSGSWEIKNDELILTYDRYDTSFTYSYEISGDTLKFDLWDQEWGNVYILEK